MSFNITFLRHGKADKTLPDHREHPLSGEGFAQARRRRQILGEPKYDLILPSPLLRAQQTALTVAGREEEDTIYVRSVLVINSLFLEDSDPRIAAVNKVFDKLGHAPLKDYEKRVKSDLDSLAEEMKADIWNIIVGAFCCDDGVSNVLVVGHAIFIPALCQAFTGQTVPFAIDVLGECEGYELQVTDMRHVNLLRLLK